MSVADKIKKNMIKNGVTKEQWAIELSTLLPLFTENNVRLVAIGFGEYGFQNFVDKKHFAGEIYLDENYQSYRALGFKRYNLFSLTFSMFNKQVLEVMSKAKKNKLKLGMMGDSFQNGGLLIVKESGEVLVTFKQANPADHLSNSEILKALGLNESETMLPDEISQPN